jgi:hypothetical protein
VFSVDRSSGPGVCTVSGTIVTYTAAGSCVIDANQAGNGSYAAAPQVQQTITVILVPKYSGVSSSYSQLRGAESYRGPRPSWPHGEARPGGQRVLPRTRPGIAVPLSPGVRNGEHQLLARNRGGGGG